MLCTELRSTVDLSDIPILLITDASSGDERIAALKAGADGFIERPINHSVLQAKVRSLLRERTVAQGLKMRRETGRALGFAETQTTFTDPGHVALVANRRGQSRLWRDQIEGLFKGRITVLTPHETLTNPFSDAPPDVFVVCACLGEDDLGLTLLAELRSRPETRDCGVIILVPDGADHLAARALDQGASDLMSADFVPEELSLRLRAQVQRRQAMRVLRGRINDGLEAAVTDPLTGLPNRRYALSHLSSLMDRCARKGVDLAVMVLDLDRFKSVNDTYGHDAGDLILSAFAGRISHQLRSEDLFARIGGEEFLVAMPGIGLTEAKAAARRICRLTSADPFDLETGQSIAVSTSIGLTIHQGQPGVEIRPEHLIKRSDQALYAAKQAGRNQVQITAEMQEEAALFAEP
jgi:two-component system cell cycle response regulator